jgi:hypothetical protein
MLGRILPLHAGRAGTVFGVGVMCAIGEQHLPLRPVLQCARPVVRPCDSWFRAESMLLTGMPIFGGP